MPRSAPTPCRYPGCPELVDEKVARGFCVGHMREARAFRGMRNRRRNFSDEDRKRDNWYSSKAWRSLRRSHISRSPLCVDCISRGILRTADVVDHIIERKDDDRRRLDSSNLQSLCHKCHNTKTVEEKRRRREANREDENEA